MIESSILERLSRVTEEEQKILRGETKIDRSLYMDGSRDVISGDKLLPPGKTIMIRPHTRFVAFPEHTHDYVDMVYMCWGGDAPSDQRERDCPARRGAFDAGAERAPVH